VLCVEKVYHNKKKQRQTRRLDKSRAKCWVCGKLGHFARDLHTEEVKSARSAVRSVSALISDLRQEEGALVLGSEAAYIDSKAETDSDHPDDNSSEVEGEAVHVNQVSAKLDEELWGDRARTEFNKSISDDAYDLAFIGIHSFSAYM
jgi:Zinc knuckle